MQYPLKPRLDDQRLQRGRRFLANRCTSLLRALPDFLLIGEMKSGTSSLFNYLQRHPNIRPPMRKELHYFSVGHHKGLGWYRAHFPLKGRSKGDWITGEACPDYLFSPDAVKRIHETLPNARFIVLLRDPVERAISHYFHELRMGREYLPILQALKAEEERLTEADVNESEGLETYLHASYKHRGHYAEQLERWFGLFPRERVLVLGSQRFFNDPAAALRESFEFLDVGPSKIGGDFEVKNPGANREEVTDDVYAYLTDYFEPHNKRLMDLLGHELDW